jgi:citrate synthase
MAAKKGQDTITVTDNRTGKTYEFPIADGTIKATDLRTIKVSDDDFGLMTYDPAFMNTASSASSATAAIRSISSLRSPASLRSPTC